MGRLGQAVRHAVIAIDAVEAVPTGQEQVRLRGERYRVVYQDRMHLAGQLVEHAAQKLRGHYALGARVLFGEGHLAGAVDGHKKVLAAFCGPDFRKIDAQIGNGVVRALLLQQVLPVAAQGQLADAMAPTFWS